MPYTAYDSTITPATSILTSLSHILHLASIHPPARTLLSARLHPSMYPLTDQIRLATQFSENLLARLTNREAVPLSSPLTTYAECQSRITTTLHALAAADKDTVNRQGDILGPTAIGLGTSVEMSAATYAHTIALPNIYFHLGTAYGILRKEGVELGKREIL